VNYIPTHYALETEEFYKSEYVMNSAGMIIAYRVENDDWQDSDIFPDPDFHPTELLIPIVI